MPQLPSPAAEEIAVVLLGALNPAIFHPQWFVRHELLAEEDVRDSQVKVVSPQVCDLTFLDFGLQVLTNRLTLKTTDVSKGPKLNDLVLGILTKLPHTPISAAGINQALHVETGDEKNWHKIGDMLAPKEPVWEGLHEAPGMLSLTIQFPRVGKFPGFTNVTVQPSAIVKHGLWVNSNVEFRPIGEVDSAQQAAIFLETHWGTATKEATLVATRIFEKILWES